MGRPARRPPTTAPVLYLDLPRAELYARIDARVRQMIADGLVEEVRALRRLPRPLSREAGQAVGYKEMFDHLDGRAGWRKPSSASRRAAATSPSGR